MATRIKTVAYNFPALTTTSTNNTSTSLTQITIYLPEGNSDYFYIQHAWVEFSADDVITVTGGSITTKTLELQLGSAGYSSTTNSNTITNTGENISLFLERDFSSYFRTNWSGTSMTCDFRFTINQSTGTTLGFRNACATVYITYEYNDTDTTQLKTVYIPMNQLTSSLATSKTSIGTIPALDTYLPEASKTYRNISIVYQGNSSTANGTADNDITLEIDSLGTYSPGTYETALASDRWIRFVWSNLVGAFTTNASHTLNMWCNVASRFFTMQVYMVVTYEFNASTTTSVMNSLLIPGEMTSPVGNSSTNHKQRLKLDFWMPEENPSVQSFAAMVFYSNINGAVSQYVKLDTGSYVSFNQGGSGLVCGSYGFLIRKDNAITFAKGRNSVFLDIYADLVGSNYSAMFMVNYTSDKSSSGIGAHNHTVMYPLHWHGTGASIGSVLTSSVGITIRETNYFISNCGIVCSAMSANAAASFLAISMEILAAEDSAMRFVPIYYDYTRLDTEIGNYISTIQIRDEIKRWNGDVDTNRHVNIESSRKYFMLSPTGHNFFINKFQMFVNYHSIVKTVSGNITNSNGGTVTIDLHRAATGEKVLTTSRVGNGSFSFNWYDDTEELYVVAYEDDTYKGRSANDYAS